MNEPRLGGDKSLTSLRKQSLLPRNSLVPCSQYIENKLNPYRRPLLNLVPWEVVIVEREFSSLFLIQEKIPSLYPSSVSEQQVTC